MLLQLQAECCNKLWLSRPTRSTDALTNPLPAGAQHRCGQWPRKRLLSSGIKCHIIDTTPYPTSVSPPRLLLADVPATTSAAWAKHKQHMMRFLPKFHLMQNCCSHTFFLQMGFHDRSRMHSVSTAPITNRRLPLNSVCGGYHVPPNC